MTDLYILSLDEVERFDTESAKALMPKRWARVQRYVRREDKLRCIGAGLMLHKVLGLKENDIVFSEHGKPVDGKGRVYFNVSHGGQYIVMAVADTEVGVDIEPVDGRHLDVARTVLTDAEREWMGLDPERRFATLWTLKEAVTKLLGEGILLPFQSFDVLGLYGGEKLTVKNTDMWAKTEAYDGCMISVCTQTPFEINRQIVKP